MDNLLKSLNKQQKAAVTTTASNVLILAGAGSGKTHTITTRIIYLIKKLNINPQNILAVTFTNKAANEMKERVNTKINSEQKVTIKTFHSFGAYILRSEFYAVQRERNFQIYDDDDSSKLINQIIKNFGLSRSELKPIKKWIQNFKQNSEQYNLVKYKNDLYLDIYRQYNKKLIEANCFDFEDLILQPNKIFEQYPELLKKYQQRFKYILIDEYQDTNNSQLALLKKINNQDSRIMVVGDEDQSIYKFRGADINIILNFKNSFDNSQTIKLEQNYRSTSNILNLANSVIKNNASRLGKNLFSTGSEGDKAIIFDSHDDQEEAERICLILNNKILDFDETAILYRTNNQSRVFEQVFKQYNIPYTIIGSVGFFDREEIKDIVSILKWLINPQDKIAFERFVNKPARGIGKKSLEIFYTEAINYQNDLFECLKNVDNIKKIPLKSRKALFNIYQIFKNKDELFSTMTISELASHYFTELGLKEYFILKDEENNTEKVQNLNDYFYSIKELGCGKEELISYLEEILLSSVITDDSEEYKGTVKLMTIHNAKGLEFENVFIAGLEEGLFPHINSSDNLEGIEEERRLFYVAITRAKKNLYLSFCNQRTLFGRMQFNEPSQFIYELDEKYLNLQYLHNANIFIKNNSNQNNKIALKKGDIIKHNEYGKGTIINIKKIEDKHLAMIDFWDHSYMELIVEFTKLEKV